MLLWFFAAIICINQTTQCVGEGVFFFIFGSGIEDCSTVKCVMSLIIHIGSWSKFVDDLFFFLSIGSNSPRKI